jgi:hypothetical protein
MTRGANDQWSSMLQGRAANPIDDIGVTEIDCDIAILHCRFDWITQVTLRHDLDACVAFGKIDNRFPHPALRANKQNTHRLFHFDRSNASSVLRSRA